MNLQIEYLSLDCTTLAAELGSLVRSHRASIEQAQREAKQLADAIAFNEACARQHQSEIARRLAEQDAEEALVSADPF